MQITVCYGTWAPTSTLRGLHLNVLASPKVFADLIPSSVPDHEEPQVKPTDHLEARLRRLNTWKLTQREGASRVAYGSPQCMCLAHADTTEASAATIDVQAGGESDQETAHMQVSLPSPCPAFMTCPTSCTFGAECPQCASSGAILCLSQQKKVKD